MVKENDKNYEITIKVREVLNEIKGFEVASGAPRTGRLIVRFTDRSGNVGDFLMELSPLYKTPTDKDFLQVVNEHDYLINPRP